MPTHGKISHIVWPSDVRSEAVVKNLCSQLLLAVLCREAEMAIHTAAIENAATVIRACRVAYLLNNTGFSYTTRSEDPKGVDGIYACLGNPNKPQYLNHSTNITYSGENPTGKRRSCSTDDWAERS